MSNKGWKQFERRLARDVGSERIPVTGERDGADFRDWLFVYSAKKRKQFPTYVAGWIASIERHAEKHGSIPVLVMQRPRHQDDDAVVAMSWRSWKRLLTYLNNARSPHEQVRPVHRSKAVQGAAQRAIPASTRKSR